MKLTDNDFDWIGQNENANCTGFDTKTQTWGSYWDKFAKVWTIGHGLTVDHTGSKVTKNTVWSIQQEHEEFRAVLKEHEQNVNVMLFQSLITLNQNQYSALVDFSYNAGASALRHSTLWKKIKGCASDEEIKTEFRRWIYANHTENNSLRNRREKEIQRYFS